MAHRVRTSMGWFHGFKFNFIINWLG
nr:transposase [Photorhabdus aegyptia]